MHVDDYVARERGNEISTSVSVNMNQRSALGGGRPPSIHVDEFMARQRERHVVVGAVPTGVENQPSVPSPLQPPADTVKVESSATSVRARPILPDEDLHDVDIDLEGVPDTDDLLSLPLGVDLVVPNKEGKADVEIHLSSGIESLRHVSVSGMLPPGDTTKQAQLDTTPSSSQNAHHPVHVDGMEPIQIRAMPSDGMPSSVFNMKSQVSQVTEITSKVAVSLRHQEPMPPTSFSSQVLHNGSTASHETTSLNVPLQRSHPQFAMAPVPPPLPPPPPIPAGVIPEKYESSSANSVKSATVIGDYRREGSTAAAPLTTIPPPFPRPSGSWQPTDQGHTPVSPATYGPIPVSHASNPQINSGSIYPHANLSPWPNMPMINEDMGAGGTGRLAPPLPPTPPPFSTNQTSVVQGPLTNNTVMHSPLPYQNVGRNPAESASLYSFPSNGDDKRFATFSSTTIGQAPTPQPHGQAPTPQLHGLPANFQPPLPPGRPNIPQPQGPIISGGPSQQLQHFHHISQQVLQPTPSAQFSSQTVVPQQFQQPIQAPLEALPPQPAQGSQIQESNLLQQILASPEAIQVLFRVTSAVSPTAHHFDCLFIYPCAGFAERPNETSKSIGTTSQAYFIAPGSISHNQ